MIDSFYRVVGGVGKLPSDVSNDSGEELIWSAAWVDMGQSGVDDQMIGSVNQLCSGFPVDTKCYAVDGVITGLVIFWHRLECAQYFRLVECFKRVHYVLLNFGFGQTDQNASGSF